MRLDRLLTIYFFHPLSRIFRQNSGLRIPILMYHSISTQDDPGSKPYYQTNTRPEVFARQMKFLADNNYQVISLSEALSLISKPSSQATNHKPPTAVSSPVTGHRSPVTGMPRYAVLTFDDGYRDFHDNAWPILEKYGFTATMFLPTLFISDQRKKLGGKDCLTWNEVKALAGEGAIFGSHTVAHVQLYNIDRQNIDSELRDSKEAIEEKLRKKIEYYSYAHAFPEQDDEFIRLMEGGLRKAGYLCAVSTRIGAVKLGENSFFLKRLPVNSQDDGMLLQAKLEGGYDWLHCLQFIKKKINFIG